MPGISERGDMGYSPEADALPVSCRVPATTTLFFVRRLTPDAWWASGPSRQPERPQPLACTPMTSPRGVSPA